MAEGVNAKLESMGESGNLSAKKMGNLLTSLNLTNRQRTNAGFILWLDRVTREEIHSMAHKYSISSGLNSSLYENCQMCQALAQHPVSGSTTPSKATPDDGTYERGELRERGEHGKQESGENHTKGGPRRPKITRPKKPAVSKPRPR